MTDTRRQLIDDLERAARTFPKAMAELREDHEHGKAARAEMRRAMRRLAAMAEAYPSSVRVQIAADRLRRALPDAPRE